MTEQWQWMGKVPVQATTRCAEAFTHTHRLFYHHSLTPTVSFTLSQHSAPPSHYLLVKPMPELGEETKRHWADYFWKGRCSSHYIHPCKNNTTSFVQGSDWWGGEAWQSGSHYRSYRQCRLATQWGANCLYMETYITTSWQWVDGEPIGFTTTGSAFIVKFEVILMGFTTLSTPTPLYSWKKTLYVFASFWKRLKIEDDLCMLRSLDVTLVSTRSRNWAKPLIGPGNNASSRSRPSLSSTAHHEERVRSAKLFRPKRTTSFFSTHTKTSMQHLWEYSPPESGMRKGSRSVCYQPQG